MQNNKNSLLVWTILLLASVKIIAQVDVFTDEITYKGGDKVYYESQPLTGTLYSNDENEIPNNCQCTLKATYSNGNLHGLKQIWHSNGVLKFKGNYIKGKPEGEHQFFNSNKKLVRKKTYQNGRVTSEIIFDDNGVKISEIPYQNGMKNGVEKVYDNNQLKAENTYVNDKLIKTTTYYPNEKKVENIYTNSHNIRKEYKKDVLINEITYKSNTTIKDGLSKKYDSSGNLISEENFVGDKLKSKKTYKNNQKDGEWFTYTNDFKIKTIIVYNSDKEISKKIINTANFIKNFNFLKGDEVVSYFDEIKNERKYYVLRIKNPNTQRSDYNRVGYRIKALVNKRAIKYPKRDYYRDNLLSGIIVANIEDVSYMTEQYNRSRVVNGKVEAYKITGYKATIEYIIDVYDMNNKLKKTFPHTIDSSSSFGRQLLSSVVTNFPTSNEKALVKALKNMHINKVYANYFPIVAKIISIKDQSSSKIKTVVINKGSFKRVYKKMLFFVYDEDSKKYKPKLKVIKVENDKAICKVLDNQEWLKNYIQTHKDVFVEEAM